MSQLIKDFSAALVAAVPTATVHPMVNSSNSLPSAIYSVRGGARDLFYTGSYGLRSTGFQVDLYAKTYTEVIGLKEAVLTAFHGFSGIMGTTLISRGVVNNIIEAHEHDQEDLYRVILEIVLLD